VDRLKDEIETLLYENAADFEIAKVLKRDIKSYFTTLEETFATTGGKDFLVKHTKRIDILLKLIYKVALRSMFGNYLPMKNAVPVGLVALGSYGREQLCVYSDIDLMIVTLPLLPVHIHRRHPATHAGRTDVAEVQPFQFRHIKLLRRQGKREQQAGQ